MKKHRISYRDWLNRGPQAPASADPSSRGPASRGPAASGTTEYTEEQQATEHAEERPTTEHAEEQQTAEVAITTADVETADTTSALSTPIAHLVFRVGRELFALPLDDVEEAIDINQVQHIPEMGPTMLGVITVRGASVPLYAPAVPLGVTGERAKSALIVVTERGRVALAVDDVDDVLVISPDAIRRSPLDFSDQVLVGVTRRGRDLIGLLAAPALIAACRTEPSLEPV